MHLRRLLTLLSLATLAAGCRGLDAAPTPAAATASATATATDTALPTSTTTQNPGAASASATPRPSPTPLAQPCQHDYLPVVAGANWSYQVSGSPAGDFDFVEQVTAVRASGFTLTSTIAGQSYAHSWACSEGGLTARQFDGMAASGIALAGGQITLQTDSVAGLSLLANLVPGDQWEQEYAISGEQAFPGLGILPVRGTVSTTYEALGVVSIRVPFGQFEALHIQAETEYDVRVGTGLISFSPEIYGTSEIYFVENLGLVKVETEFSLMGEAQHSSIELTNYSFR